MTIEKTPGALIVSLPESGSLPPVIFLYGPDGYTRETLIERIIKRFLSGMYSHAFGLEEIEAPEADPGEVLDTLRTIPMGRPLKIVVLRRFELASASVLKEGKKQTDAPNKRGGGSPLDAALSKYLSHPSRKTLLLISSAAGLKKNSQLYRSLPENAFLVSCPGFRGHEANRFVKGVLTRNGKVAPEGWIDQMIEMVGPDAQRLAAELEKVLLLVGDRETLQENDLDIVSSVEMPRDVFALLNAIGTGRQDLAMEIMREILRTAEPPLKILSVLLWHYRLVMRAQYLATRGERSESHKIHPSRFVARRVIQQGRELSPTSLREIFTILQETDRLLKGSRLPVSHIMESLVFTLAKHHELAHRSPPTDQGKPAFRPNDQNPGKNGVPV